MNKKTIAICVGHSRSNDDGAVNVDGVTEWAFNQPLAKRVCALVAQAGHNAILVDLYDGPSYGSAMRWLAEHLKQIKADVAVELHFNSAGSMATGYEFLYCGTSPKGLTLASKLSASFAKAFPEQKNRGLKALNKSDRGGTFVMKTHCPAVICEPFFGSNRKDSDFFSAHREELAKAYAEGILNWLVN